MVSHVHTKAPPPSQYNSTNQVTAAKTKRARRKLAEQEPKTIENPKTLLTIKGNKTSEILNTCLHDMAILKKPHSKALLKHNNVQPFIDASSLEFLAQKNDSSLVLFGAHTKKKPHTLTVIRMFDYTVYDMAELQIDASKYISMDEFDALKKRVATVRTGSVPLLLFHGDLWHSNTSLEQVKPVLIDLLHGETLEHVNLSAVDHVVVCTALLSNNGQPTVAVRHYGILMKKSGNKFPRIELDEVGPRLNLIVKQYREPDSEQRDAAMQKVKSLKATLGKNMEAGTMGDTMGRIHVDNQPIDTMALFKQKGLKAKRGRQETEMTAEQVEQLAEDDEDYEHIPQSINKVVKRKIT